MRHWWEDMAGDREALSRRGWPSLNPEEHFLSPDRIRGKAGWPPGHRLEATGNHSRSAVGPSACIRGREARRPRRIKVSSGCRPGPNPPGLSDGACPKVPRRHRQPGPGPAPMAGSRRSTAVCPVVPGTSRTPRGNAAGIRSSGGFRFRRPGPAGRRDGRPDCRRGRPRPGRVSPPLLRDLHLRGRGRFRRSRIPLPSGSVQVQKRNLCFGLSRAESGGHPGACRPRHRSLPGTQADRPRWSESGVHDSGVFRRSPPVRASGEAGPGSEAQQRRQRSPSPRQAGRSELEKGQEPRQEVHSGYGSGAARSLRPEKDRSGIPLFRQRTLASGIRGCLRVHRDPGSKGRHSGTSTATWK